MMKVIVDVKFAVSASVLVEAESEDQAKAIVEKSLQASISRKVDDEAIKSINSVKSSFISTSSHEVKREIVPDSMKSYHKFKKLHPEAVLLFRCGDFYETYAEDAVVCFQILGITLTARTGDRISEKFKMAGFPYHALDTYLPKLIRAGQRVAICDPLEKPQENKPKKSITEIVTPHGDS